jgi:hypothetical protein
LFQQLKGAPRSTTRTEPTAPPRRLLPGRTRQIPQDRAPLPPRCHGRQTEQAGAPGGSRRSKGGKEEGEDTDLRVGGGAEGHRPSGRPPYQRRHGQQAATALASKRRRRQRVTGVGGGWGLATLTAHPLTHLYGPRPVGRLGPQQAGTRPTWAANKPAHLSRITPPGSRSPLDPLQLLQSSIYLPELFYNSVLSSTL